MYPGPNVGMPWMASGPWMNGGFWMTVTSVIWLALTALAVIALVWIVVRITRARPGADRTLDELYAKGLMTWDEYLRRRDLARIG